MTLPIRMLYSGAPPLENLAEEDVPRAALIHRNLRGMSYYSNEVTDAAGLFLAIRNTKMTRGQTGWAIIPPKQAIVSIYNFRMAMDATHRITCASAQIKNMIDTRQMELIKSDFRLAFPSTKELRQALLHHAELHSNQQRIKETKTRKQERIGPVVFGENSAAQFNVINSGIQVTFSGSVYIQDISPATAQAITNFAVSFAKVYEPLGGSVRFLQP